MARPRPAVLLFAAAGLLGLAPLLVAATSTPPDDCPMGTTRAGKGPPDGNEVWCERVDSDGKHVKHGPYQAWTVTGIRQEDGQYENGHKEGSWTTYWDNGSNFQEGPYREGMREGSWICGRHRRACRAR